MTRDPTPASVRSAAGWWTLGGIILVAAAVRVPGLGENPWFDEIVTYVTYTGRPFAEIVTRYDSQNQHVLYSLLARAARLLFGEGAGPLRLPALLFGLGSLVALYDVARVVGKPSRGLWGAALLALSYHHVWFSQNARGYTGLLFFTLVSSSWLVRALQRSTAREWGIYAVAVALGCYTHLTMLFPVAGHFLIAAGYWARHRDRDAMLRLLAGFSAAGVLTFLLYSPLLGQMFGGTLGQGGGVDRWRNPLWALYELARGMRIGPLGGVAGLAGASVFGLGCYRLWRERSFLFALFWVPVLVCAAAILAAGHHLWPRFFFFAAGFAVLIVVEGAFEAGSMLSGLLQRPRMARALGSVLCTAMVLVSATTVPRAWLPKQDFRGAIEYLEVERRPGDAVVTVGMAIIPYRDYYGLDWQPVLTVEELEAIRSQAERTWLVYTVPFHLEAFHPDLHGQVEGEFNVIERFPGTLGDGTVFVCRFDRRGLG